MQGARHRKAELAAVHGQGHRSSLTSGRSPAWPHDVMRRLETHSRELRGPASQAPLPAGLQTHQGGADERGGKGFSFQELTVAQKNRPWPSLALGSGLGEPGVVVSALTVSLGNVPSRECPLYNFPRGRRLIHTSRKVSASQPFQAWASVGLARESQRLKEGVPRGKE